MRATQAISGAPRCSIAAAAMPSRAITAATACAAEPTMQAGAAAAASHRFAQRRQPRRRQRPAAGSKYLQVDMVVPRVDRRDHRHGSVGIHQWRGQSGQSRQPDRRLCGGERDAARRGNADPQSGKAAGPGRHHHAVEFAKRRPRLVHDPGDERHQRLGMAALHHQALGRHDAVVGVEHGRGAGRQGGIDGENAHQPNRWSGRRRS